MLGRILVKDQVGIASDPFLWSFWSDIITQMTDLPDMRWFNTSEAIAGCGCELRYEIMQYHELGTRS